MYNEKRKLNYISTKNLKNNYLLKIKFETSEPYEIKKDKDLCEWSLADIVSFYKELCSKSLETLMVINNAYENYTKWCGENGYCKKDKNVYAVIDNDTLKGCLESNPSLTREAVVNVCNSLANPSDAFLIMGLFEGIAGPAYEEFWNLKEDNYDPATGKIRLCTGRQLEISPELATLLRESCHEYRYYPMSGAAKCEYSFDSDDKTVLKRMYNYKKDPEADANRTLERTKIRFNRIRANCPELENLTMKKIQESGRIDYVKALAQPGEKPKDTILRNREVIEYRYGKMSSVERWLVKYEDRF